MSTIATLMDTAVADVELLRVLDADGDDFSIPRDVEFLLRGTSAEKTSLVASFINDHQYGRASADHQSGEIYRVLVVINMPIQQHNILSVSGFMACLSMLYGLEYDGWGCLAQRRH
ncbi:TPA: ribonuclease E inhibitor RraB [Burkholderia cenocepacia]|uniref:ribonuclease E inhibitor RraB n=1 Tax=unclassified Burkholderia TaxID=2613784 RepID=UPI00158B52BD|nr:MULTISPECIES: ribonuclease E inhibitor RraB [unclassified Burkholderia]HEF5874760.1 ribonuclease E inhibitor RraB [Burkholderia cenocepacia]